jgi:hydrogenase maturation factor HypE
MPMAVGMTDFTPGVQAVSQIWEEPLKAPLTLRSSRAVLIADRGRSRGHWVGILNGNNLQRAVPMIPLE